MLAIITAMDSEISDLRQKLTKSKTLQINGTKYTKGKINGKTVILCDCGIGKVNMAVAAANLSGLKNVDVLINCGVAAGIGKQIRQGDTVLGSGFVYHDYESDDENYRHSVYECSHEINTKIEDVIKRLNKPYRMGIIATGDQFIKSKQKADEIANKFSASACDMESTAFVQACVNAKKKCAVIRTVSDFGDNIAADSFYEYLTNAVKVNLEIVNEFILSL